MIRKYAKKQDSSRPGRRARAEDTALSAAIRKLARRAYAERELVRKLAEKYPAAEIRDAVARLRSLHLLDDPMFVRQFSESALTGKRKGLRYIRWELQHRGVADALINETLEAGRDGERAAAVLVAKRLEAKGREIRNIAGALQRRGFTSSAITHALHSLRTTGGNDDVTNDMD
ncbi:MAG: regulatory protein RecX [bacterium]